MELTVLTEKLKEAVNTIIPALASRIEAENMRAYEFIHASLGGGVLILTCSNLNIQISTEFDVYSEESANFMIPGKLFAEIVKTLPDENTTFDANENKVSISSGELRITLQTVSPNEFVGMKEYECNPEVRMQEGVLKKMILQTAPFALQDNTRPILEGVLIEPVDDALCLVALDGLKLARRIERVDNVYGNGLRVIVPAKLLETAARVLNDSAQTINVHLLKQNFMIRTARTCIIIRTIQGEFIKFEGMLPVSYETQVFADHKTLNSLVERAYLVAREEKNNIIKFQIEEETLSVSVNNEVGNITDKMSVVTSGDGMSIAFNARYILDILKYLDDDEICIQLNSPTSPCVIRPAGNMGYYYLVLPIRLM